MGLPLKTNVYDFSEDIVCVEVLLNGERMGAFCLEKDHFQELETNEIEQLASRYVRNYEQHKRNEKKDVTRRKVRDFEFDFQPFSDDMMCITLYKDGVMIDSICVDHQSFQEWLEDEKLFEKILIQQYEKR